MPKAAFDQTAMNSETPLFRTAVSNWQAPRVIFHKKKGAVGAAPKARVRSLAAEGGVTEELKTCLRENRFPQRAINLRNGVPKAAFNQTAMDSETTLFFTAVSNWQAPTLICAGPESGRRRRRDGGAQNMSTRVPLSAKSD